MIVKSPQREAESITMTTTERREALIELWASIFERELRAHVEEARQQGVASDPSEGCFPGE